MRRVGARPGDRPRRGARSKRRESFSVAREEDFGTTTTPSSRRGFEDPTRDDGRDGEEQSINRAELEEEDDDEDHHASATMFERGARGERATRERRDEIMRERKKEWKEGTTE